MVNPANSSQIYASTFGNGVRRSIDGGQSWNNYNAGLPYLSVFSVKAATGRPHTLYAATFGGSIYRVDEITAVNEQALVISDFALAQNYPNPFRSGATSHASGGGNPSTNIEYSLRRASQVSLKIYSVRGEEIAVLINEKQPAGVHRVAFDGARLASGVYFYRLQAADPARGGAGELIATRKFILLR